MKILGLNVGGVSPGGGSFTTVDASTSVTTPLILMTAAASTTIPSIRLDANTGIGLRSAGAIGLFAGGNLMAYGFSTGWIFGNAVTDSFSIKGPYITLNSGAIATTQTYISNNVTDGSSVFAGGSSATGGGNFVGYGSTHATKPSFVELRQGSTVICSIGTGGLVTIGNGSATTHALNTLVNTAGVQVGTLTNCPSAGNPAGFVTMTINGATRYIPFWS